jgi:hypothetical protein
MDAARLSEGNECVHDSTSRARPDWPAIALSLEVMMYACIICDGVSLDVAMNI